MKFKRIKELRLEMGMSRAETAKICGVTTNTYSRYEMGETKTKVVKMLMLADFYDVPIDYIMELTDQRKRK